jgi:hypothetical protein
MTTPITVRMTGPAVVPSKVTRAITVTRDEVAELARLLGVVEDWLLGCDEFVHADLEAFLPHTDGPGRGGRFIDDLGDAGVHLTRLLRGDAR